MKLLTEYIQLHKPELQENLNNFINQKIDNDVSQIVYYQDFLKRLIEFSANGKMLRGLLVMFTSEMLGKKIGDEEIKAGCAIELIHAGLLIHDDIIDRDNLRRGKKTIYAQYQEEGETKNTQDPAFYGLSMGLCAGDISLLLAVELLGSLPYSEVVTNTAAEIQRVAAAEMLDFHFGEVADEPTQEDILNMYKNKSARHTFCLPFKIGCLMASASDKNTQVLEKLGEKIGVIFQIKDDEIGILGDQVEIGKPVGSDIRQNKKTLLRTLLYQKSQNKEDLDKIFGNPHVTVEQIEQIKKSVHDLGVKDELSSIMNSLAAEAYQLLEKLDVEGKYKETLKELINYNIKRSS
jgi:geranylgeranyl diphosphate synthase type I